MKLSLLRRNSSTPPPSPVTSPKTTPRTPPGGSTAGGTGLAKWEDKLQQQSSSPNPTPTVSSLLPSPRTFIYPQPPPDLAGGAELGGGSGGAGGARLLPSPTASPRDRPCSPRWVPDKANPDEQLLRAHAQAQAMAFMKQQLEGP